MAHIHPFKAWHPNTSDVKTVSCPPYDVLGSPKARTMAQGNPKSFLHVTKPEIDLPDGAAFNDPRVYQQGAENLHEFMDQHILQQDEQPSLYIYRLKWKGRTQTGIYGCVSVRDYDENIILKHELTRPDKEDDRTRHITSQQAHAEPVMLTCKDQGRIATYTTDFCAHHDPLFDFTSTDKVTHTLWQVKEPQALIEIFGQFNHLYIADGHHRCKAASRAAAKERGKHPEAPADTEFNYFPAVILPMEQMQILAYNRLIHRLPQNFMSKLKQDFNPRPTSQKKPDQKGHICMYANGSWFNIELPIADEPSAVERLDAYRLQHFLLEPLLDIKDPRRDDNISFVGGVLGADELERQVDSGEADLAISMYPTDIKELVEVSDQGLLMPPKSTWFEPKLRSGLLVHTF